jgi:hypothetical protein
LILLSDANVLIDLGYVDGLELLVHLAPTEVLDVVLDECEHPSQPGLVSAIEASGVTVVTTKPGWLVAARAYRSAELSDRDRLNLYYAKTYQRILLAGDLPLRERCTKEGVEVHGSLWLIEQAFTLRLIKPDELCRWLRVWPTLGRRLPSAEMRRLARLLGCP